MDMTQLGGRLPLLDPGQLNGEQKAVYDRLRGTMIKWANESGFQSMAEGGRLIGPFNPILFSPDLARAFLDLQDAEKASTSLSECLRQVVILSVGAVWRSEYELYAHVAVGKSAGLPDEIVRNLGAGRLPDDLDEQVKIAARFVRQLSAEHRVEPDLYRAAETAFGKRGLVDITFLAGIYHIVCGLLSAFEIPAPAGQSPIVSDEKPKPSLTDVALFPKKSFLENLAVRSDNSVLVTSANTKQLFYVPPTTGTEVVEPVLLHTFEQLPLNPLEIEPDLFLVSTSNLYTTHESFMHLLDLRNWRPGDPVNIETVFRFPDKARGLNGSCLLAPGVVLVADCFASLIWRLDIQPGGRTMEARVWLEHTSMDYFPGKMKPEQPGVNGVRYAAKSNYLYYTSTAKKLLMRVLVDPGTLEAAGHPELVLAGRMGDDFLIDEDAQVIYLTTHRQNTIDRVSMDPAENSGFSQVVIGDPFTEAMIGPSSGAWSRRGGDYGKVAYFTCDGGTASPPPGGPQAAKLFRVDFQEHQRG
jgi:alkylhydroperoxidase family enzyme